MYDIECFALLGISMLRNVGCAKRSVANTVK